MSLDRWVSRASVAAMTLVLLVTGSVGGVAAARVAPTHAGTGTTANDVIPPFLASPAPLAFPGVAVATASSVLAVTFSNSTPDPQTVATVDVDGAAASDFAITTETCTTGPVAAGGTCTVDVQFTPGALGMRVAALHLHDATPVVVGTVTLQGLGQAASHVGWGALRTAGPGRTWSYGSELARSVTSTSTRYLQAVYTRDLVGGRYVTDHGPYLGIYYIRSASSTGTTWSTPVRLNSATKHGDGATIATSGAYVYVAWVSQTKYINYDPNAPRSLYIRVNSNYGKGTWRSAIRLSSLTGRVYDAHVAAAGSHVYVAVTDSNSGKIRLYISDNHGRTWRSVTVGTTTNSSFSGRQGSATVDASGSTVVVSWIGDEAHTIKVRRSATSGKTWGSTSTLANGSSGLPDVAVASGRAVVAWPTDDGIDLRVRTSSGWGPVRHVTPPDNGKPYDFEYAPAVAVNGSSRVGVAWTACWSACDTNDFEADMAWAETADNGASWYATQLVGPASSSAYHVNDGAAVIWPATGRRTILWNGYTPGTASTRLYIRSAIGAP